MTGIVRKGLDWVIGLTLIALGILGGFIPFLPGWVFVFAGLAVLSSHSRLARTIQFRLKEQGRRITRWFKERKRPDRETPQ